MNNDLYKALAVIGIWAGGGLIAAGKDQVADMVIAALALVATFVVWGAIKWPGWRKSQPAPQPEPQPAQQPGQPPQGLS